MASLFNERQQGNFPSTSEVKPRRDDNDHCKAITLRNRKTVERLIQKSTKNDEDIAESEENNAGNLGNNDETIENSAETTRKSKKLLKILASKEQRKMKLKAPSRENTPVVPYPQRLKKNKVDNQFGKFMEIFIKLHINIPFVDALEQILLYAKFMKDILANKIKLSDYETVALSEECSAILQRKLPPKLKDTGSFTIPCSIGNSIFEKPYVILVLVLT